MLSLYRDSLKGQYFAAIDMLRRSIELCPDDLWADDSDGGPPAWRLAYHSLFYLDLYLSEGEASFSPTPFHEKRHQFFGGDVPFPPYKIEPPQTVLTKEQLLDYADDCRKKAGRVIEGLDEAKLRADAPFEWLPMPTAELML